jgi:hypothetical protein
MICIPPSTTNGEALHPVEAAREPGAVDGKRVVAAAILGSPHLPYILPVSWYGLVARLVYRNETGRDMRDQQ